MRSAGDRKCGKGSPAVVHTPLQTSSRTVNSDVNGFVLKMLFSRPPQNRSLCNNNVELLWKPEEYVPFAV